MSYIIKERRGNIVLLEYTFSRGDFVHRIIRHDTKDSDFSAINLVPYSCYTLDNGFEICKILSELEDVCMYLFDSTSKGTWCCINDIKISHYDGMIELLDKSNNCFVRYEINNKLIENVINHPVLQPYRINRSKPINPAMFE